MANATKIVEHLSVIQSTLKAPKGQFNAFGKYAYRSCEDILESVKPLLNDAIITLSDEVVAVGSMVFITATATYRLGDDEISVSASAGHPFERKGMDLSQITGCSSSYARKYALNGLLLIDDTKDSDTKEAPPPPPPEKRVIQASKEQVKALETAIKDKWLGEWEEKYKLACKWASKGRTEKASNLTSVEITTVISKTKEN